MRIVSREEWGAQPPRATTPLQTPVDTVIVYNETPDTPVCYTKKECIKTMQGLQKDHLEKGYKDIRYNFLIGLDGRVYEGRGWQNQGNKFRRHENLETHCITIAYIGNFEDWLPPPRMLELVPKLIKYGKKLNYITKKYRRGDVNFETMEVTYKDEW